MTATARRLAADRGTGAVEALGGLPWLLLAGLLVWQLLLTAAAAAAAEHAARNAGLVQARGATAVQVGDTAVSSLSPWLRSGATAVVSGGRVTVRVPVPVVAPGVRSDALVLERSATFPAQ